MSFNYETNTKTFEKKSVIENGKLLAKKRKIAWLITGMAVLFVILLYDLLFFINHGGNPLTDKDIFVLVIQQILFVGFSIFAIIFSIVRKYNFLLLGCEVARRYENQSKQKTSFKVEELYDLLSKNDVVKYSWTIKDDIVRIPSYSNHNKRIRRADCNSSNHHFDSELTDEEFDDLMD